MRVRDVMTYGVIGVAKDTSVAEAVETMLRSHVSALFVFDAKLAPAASRRRASRRRHG